MTNRAFGLLENKEAGGPIQKLVLLTVALRADQDGFYQFCRTGLAEACEINEYQLVEALEGLSARGLLGWRDGMILVAGHKPVDCPRCSDIEILKLP